MSYEVNIKITNILFYSRLMSVIIFLVLNSATLGQSTINFDRLSIQDGLSNRNVLCLIQDHYGFMWIGTNDGLNMYDGKKFRIFKNDPSVPNSLSNSNVISLFEDSGGDLWVSTASGLNLYRRETESFERFYVDENDKENLSVNSIIVVNEDSKGNLYAGTVTKGIQKIDRANKKLTPFIQDPSAGPSFDIVFSIFTDKNDDLWYLHLGGGELIQELRYYQIESKELKKFKLPHIERNSAIGDIRGLGISCGFEDHQGKVWLGTADGHLMNFDESKGIFGKTEISKGTILMGIAEDDSSNFWIASFGKGLIKFNPSSGEKTYYKNDPSNSFSLSHDYTITAYRDRAGLIWIGTASGVDRFDPYKTPFKIYQKIENDKTSLSSNQVSAIIESYDGADKILVGTIDGLNILDTRSDKFRRVRGKSQNASGYYTIRQIIKDGKGKYWIATLHNGLEQYDPTKNKFYPVLTPPDISPIIRDIVQTESGALWLSTDNGLVHFNPISNSKRTYFYLDTSYTKDVFQKIENLRGGNSTIAAINRVGNNADTSLTFKVDSPLSALVVVMGENGMANFKNTELFDYGWIENENGDRVWEIDNAKTNHAGGSVKNRIVADLIELDTGVYRLRYISDDSHSFEAWNDQAPITEEYWGIQVYKLNLTETAFFNNNLNRTETGNSPPSNNLTSLCLDSDGYLWIGSKNSGLSKYDPVENNFSVYKAHGRTDESVIDDRIVALYRDKDEKIWITTQGGISVYDKSSKKFKHFTEDDGFPTNFFSDIIEDDRGTYWVSSLNGISRFIPGGENTPTTIINYGIEDGLRGYEFYSHSKCKTSEGQIYLGGKDGMISFYPGDVNPYPPDVVITDFELFNESVKPNMPGSPLTKSIMATDEIVLKPGQRVFGFEFEALHFSRMNKNIFSYKLDGVDKTWITGKRNFVTYSNLDAGEYIFNVKAANSDGVWNTKGKTIKIIALEHWYKTFWAYAAYVIIFIAGFVGITRYQKKKLIEREREKAVIEQAELRALAAEAQARAVQAENERKTKELEEARELQLSMLPKDLPNLPHLDIAVYMQTATEVGGDYYDFHVGLDGTLTVVIGDATGHGLNAGTIVTATKSLFNTHAANPDILFTFSEINRVIKGMQFRLLSMCLSMIKIKENQLTISSAGMPPALIYRDADNSTDEFLIRGMPLGVRDDFPYEVRTTDIQPGDTILLMSDGFPELFNAKKEMLGYDTAKTIFNQVSEKAPDEIINQLKNKAADWADGRPPDDDVTFVVIKVK